MEWLSHSQKKYCELCKTSFRFTKLYAPDMPQSLPVHVFVGHLAKYMFRNVLVWLRIAMAISVWLCWLPYFMRSVWSFMFWVSDEGLGNTSLLSRTNETAEAALRLASTGINSDTCPASPLFASTTTSAAAAETILQSLSGQNISDFLMRVFFGSLGMSTRSDRSEAALESAINATYLEGGLIGTAPPTLLGEVAFLNNLTRNPMVNRTFISILEGQIITILVIVCFILVILVRDYVVQQQPEMNMRAAFAAPENPIPPQGPLLVRPEDMENLEQPDESDDETLDDGERVEHVDEFDQTRAGDPVNPRLVRRPTTELRVPSGVVEEEPQSAPRTEPHNPSESSLDDERTSINDYLRIYRRAGGDSEKILQIVEEEGFEEKLSYWVDITRRSIREDTDASKFVSRGNRHDLGSHNGHSEPSDFMMAGPPSRITHAPVPNEGFQTGRPHDEYQAASWKGKSRDTGSPIPESTDSEGSSWRTGLSSSSSRPRAVSDGPQLHDSVNPLANNSWSFAGLPSVPRPEDMTPPIRQELNHSELAQEDRFDHIVEPASFQSNNDRSAYGDGEYTHPDPPLRDDVPEPEHVPALRALPTVQAGNDVPADQDGNRAPGLVDRVTDFMWGNLDDHQLQNDIDNPLADLDAEDEWVDIDEINDPIEEVDDDADNIDAGPAAGMDQEAMEDMEDFEGVMELIGMRGPIAGLFQNAIFCAVLVSVTIFACIFIPYNIGRVSVWILANPLRLIRLLFELSTLLQDAAIMVIGFASWIAVNLVDIVTGLIGGAIASHVVSARKAAWVFWTGAGRRVVDYALMDFPMSASEMQNFSAISHGALLTVKAYVGSVFTFIGSVLGYVVGGRFLSGDFLTSVVSVFHRTQDNWGYLQPALFKPNTWVIDLSESEGPTTFNPELAFWSGVDRFWAILAGYVTLFFVSAMYLKRGSPFSRGHLLQAWEAGIIDTLHQASGIMKVIMIISIEMLVFPLYCGLLLDGALLPLFEDTTFKSRILFTYNYPLTSVFVHWFVGTGYMFHFALFVSMCRKIMRQGVLCKFSTHLLQACCTDADIDFIRDPDDPEFHPVRDVLERNLTTQLRKIMFSAFVYGALVIVCLGGVVWGLSYTMPNVLPIHYSSNEPVLEFPVDLLFYNFLMPLAVGFFKPGDGLHAMYTWWFRTCARCLRLTFFLFGERHLDEEGTLHLTGDSPYHQLQWYKTVLLEVDDQYNVVPKTWNDVFDGGDAKPKTPPLSQTELNTITCHKERLKNTGQLVDSGYFVRAPASDRVKIPKGKKVFLEVSERGKRRDIQTDVDLYTSNQYQMVYIPPHFRARVFLFILFIWIFAAVTGVGFTIIPLVFGRRMFKMLIPAHIRTNDIYAFSIGVYLLGSLAYLGFHIRSVWAKVQGWIASANEAVDAGGIAQRATDFIMRGVTLVYSYFFLIVVFPLLVSVLMELYVAIPLHTYMYPPTAASVQASWEGGSEASRHTVRVIQSWTLGLLYLRLSARAAVVLFADTRLAVAVRTVLRRGWMHPDASVLTRAFVVPGLAIFAAAVFGPPAITDALIKYGVIKGAQAGANKSAEISRLIIIYRQSFPAVALASLVIKNTIGLIKVFNGWTARIRDEAYLIGERLHNFGAAAAGARRVRGAWRAGGARL